jgi:hypothetical protein
MVQINFEKKDLWLVLAIFVFISGTGIVISFTTDGSGNPAVMGHSFDEINLPNCNDGEILKKAGGVWECVVDAGSSGGGQIKEKIVINENPSTDEIPAYLKYSLVLDSDKSSKTKEIGEDIINSFCGDYDGCQVRLAYITPIGVASVESTLLYYDSSTGSWRSSFGKQNSRNVFKMENSYGVDNDNKYQPVIFLNPLNYHGCFFLDGDPDGESTSSSSGDHKKGFVLKTYQHSAYSDVFSCHLTLFD